MSNEALAQNIAKILADGIGHGMAEKCETLAVRVIPALREALSAAQPVEEAIGLTTMKPSDPVEVTRAQANAYFATMKILGLQEYEYLPDAIRRLQSIYDSAVKGRAVFRDALAVIRSAQAAKAVPSDDHEMSILLITDAYESGKAAPSIEIPMDALMIAQSADEVKPS